MGIIPRICVVGAGPSGLITAKELRDQLGANVTILEAGQSIGGVWRQDRIYDGATTQTPADLFGYSQRFGHLPETSWASAEQVRAEFQAYADHHDLMSQIFLNSAVTAIMPQPGGTVRVQFRHDGRLEEQEFDHVVVATGMFEQPKYPDGIDPDEVLHSSQITDLSCFKGQNVLVNAYGRSGTEIATLLANRSDCLAKSVHLVFRQAHWKVPRVFEFPCGVRVNMEDLLFSRFSEWFFPSEDAGLMRQFVEKTFIAGAWKLMERTLIKQFHLDELDLIPKTRFQDEVSSNLPLETIGLQDSLREGRIQPHLGEIAAILPGRVFLKDGTRIPADQVIVGTGFKQTPLPFLSHELNAQLVDPNNGMYRLYRHMVPLGVPGLMFAMSGGFYSPLTAEVGAHWMAAYLKGDIKVSPETMATAVAADHRRRLKRPIETQSAGLSHAPQDRRNYIDKLMRDMGLPAYVQDNWLWEFFGPIKIKAYAKHLDKQR